jgi:hypothetical protein
VCCLRNEPPPLLFIGLSTDVKRSEKPREWPLGPIVKHHMEAQDQPTQGQFDRSLGSTDRQVGPLKDQTVDQRGGGVNGSR